MCASLDALPSNKSTMATNLLTILWSHFIGLFQFPGLSPPPFLLRPSTSTFYFFFPLKLFVFLHYDIITYIFFFLSYHVHVLFTKMVKCFSYIRFLVSLLASKTESSSTCRCSVSTNSVYRAVAPLPQLSHHRAWYLHHDYWQIVAMPTHGYQF